MNLAQAYKWSGNVRECDSILQALDTSAMKTDLQIPKKVLEEKFEEVFPMMRTLGKDSQILTIDAYREWPIFQKIREEKEFEETFQSIFEEPLVISESAAVKKIDIEDIQECTLVKTIN